MRFSYPCDDCNHSVDFSKGRHFQPLALGPNWDGKRMVVRPKGLEFLAQHLYSISDRNPHDQAHGFPTYDDLPNHLKCVWIQKARDVLFAVNENIGIIDNDAIYK